jgi:hypothetical protein
LLKQLCNVFTVQLIAASTTASRAQTPECMAVLMFVIAASHFRKAGVRLYHNKILTRLEGTVTSPQLNLSTS